MIWLCYLFSEITLKVSSMCTINKHFFSFVYHLHISHFSETTVLHYKLWNNSSDYCNFVTCSALCDYWDVVLLSSLILSNILSDIQINSICCFTAAADPDDVHNKNSYIHCLVLNDPRYEHSWYKTPVS